MNVSTSKIECKYCHAVLFVAAVRSGLIEIKCRRGNCKRWNLIDIKRGVAKIKIKEENTLLNKRFIAL